MWDVACVVFGILFVLSACGWFWFGYVTKPADPLDKEAHEKTTTGFMIATIVTVVFCFVCGIKWYNSPEKLQKDAAETIIELSQLKTVQSPEMKAKATAQCDQMFANDADKTIANQYLSMKQTRPIPEVMNLCNNRAKGLTGKMF